MKTKEITLFEEKTITSLELVDQINLFRLQFNEDAKTLLHKTFIAKIVKELQATKNVGLTNEQNILPVKYTDKKGEKRTMYTLSHTTSLMLAASEVAEVRALVRKWVDDLKKENKALKKSINDVLIERLDSGERKIIKRFITDTITASGYSGLRDAVTELNKTTIGKDYKEWLLKQLSTSFDVYINSMSIKEYKKINIDADKVELELKHNLQKFYSYSRGQVTRALEKQNKAVTEEKKALRIAKDSITHAYLNMKPKWFTGKFKVEVDEDTQARIYVVDNDEIEMVIAPTSFLKDGEDIYYMSGTVHIKDESLYLNVTGGYDATIFQTKTRDLEKTMYNLMVSVDLSNHTYNIVLTKIK